MRFGRLKSKNQKLIIGSYHLRTKIIFHFTILIYVFGLPVTMGNTTNSKSVESLIIALERRDGFSKDDAINALVKMGDSAVEPLIAVLKNDKSFGRKYAAVALGKIGDTRAVEPLIVVLKDDDNDVRMRAAEALDKLGWQAKDEKEKISYLIAKRNWGECVKIGSPAVEPLVAALKIAGFKTDDIINRRNAAVALGKIGDTRAVEPLIVVLKDDDSDVRMRAAEALDKLGWQAKDEKEKISYLIAKRNWGECVKIGSPAIEPLVVALKYGASVRMDVGGALAKIGKSAIEPLIVALKDDDSNVRIGAAYTLGSIGDTRAVEPLIAKLKDEDDSVRSRAATALGKIEDTRAVEPLIAVLKDDEQKSYVRMYAAEALGNIGDQTAIPALITSLKDWELGKQAVNSLKKIGWHPESITDKVHYAVAMRDKDALIMMWEQTKSVLLEDVISSEYRAIENALYAFIAMGKQEIIPTLINTLNSTGNKTMSEAYLNCGNKELDSAAREWVKKHGYSIISGAGASPVGWGSWR